MDPETDALLRDMQQIINLSRRERGAEGGKDEYALTLIARTAEAALRKIRALSDTSLFVVEEFRQALKDRDK